MNWILIKDKILMLLFWAAITFEVVAVWNLLADLRLRTKRLFKKRGVKQ